MKYDEELERLGKLPRAERFERLIQFPVEHTFKVIGRSDGFFAVLEQALGLMGHADAILVERQSAQGKFVSLTFTLKVANGAELDRIYTVLEALPGLAYLL